MKLSSPIATGRVISKWMPIIIGPIYLAGLLCVAFIVLKLSGSISWPWWLVLAPLWVPYTLALGVMGVFVIQCATIAGISEIFQMANRKRGGK
jgi:uncharacterized membrane protein YhdT